MDDIDAYLASSGKKTDSEPDPDPTLNA
jgi:hypothetical protein